MKLAIISKRLRVGGRIAATVAVLLVWLGVCALEVSPELHHFFHKDSQSPAHNCLVSQLQQHSIASGFISAVAPVAPVDCTPPAAQGQSQIFASYDYRLSPSRAPPLA